MDFVATFAIESCVIYCDDVAILTSFCQTLAASKEAERDRLLAEQGK